MDLITTLLGALQEKALQYVYWELVMAIVSISYIAIYFIRLKSKTIHPKWVTLIVAVLLSGLMAVTKPEAFDLWKAIISLSLAVIFYDYIVKVVVDLIKKKSPAKDNT